MLNRRRHIPKEAAPEGAANQAGSVLAGCCQARPGVAPSPGGQAATTTAAAGEYALSLAEFNMNNARALRELRADGSVHIRRFDDEMLRTFAEISRDVVAEAASGDPLSGKIHESYGEFRALIRDWTDVAEGAYLDARDLV